MLSGCRWNSLVGRGASTKAGKSGRFKGERLPAGLFEGRGRVIRDDGPRPEKGLLTARGGRVEKGGALLTISRRELGGSTTDIGRETSSGGRKGGGGRGRSRRVRPGCSS